MYEPLQDAEGEPPLQPDLEGRGAVRRVFRGSWTDLGTVCRVSVYGGLWLDRRWIYPGSLVITAAGYEALATLIGPVIGNFYASISSLDGPLFLRTLWQSLLLILGIAMLRALRDFASDVCSLNWRSQLVGLIHSVYFRDKGPYGLGSVDTPDQRITADADTFAVSLAEALQKTVIVPGLLLYYTSYLVAVFGPIAPICCYFYFGLSWFVNARLIRGLVPAIMASEREEGVFRFAHAQCRSCADSIAFSGPRAAEEAERMRLGKLFSAALDARWGVLRARLRIYCSTQFFNYLGSIVNYAAIGASILYSTRARGLPEPSISALVARGSYACLYLISAFSQVLETSEALARAMGSAGRVLELLHARGFQSSALSDDKKWGAFARPPLLIAPHSTQCSPWHYASALHCKEMTLGIGGDPDCLLRLNHLSVSVGERGGALRTLVKDLTLQIRRGENIAISGPCGSGKTSLLKVLIGMEPGEGGSISYSRELAPSTRPQAVMFLPQKPYCFHASLADNIIYPACASSSGIDFGSLKVVLEVLGLDRLIGSVSVVKDWSAALSQGEQQLVCISRLLYHKPLVAFCDESTSAMDELSEKRVYEALVAAGMTLVSVSHRPSLRQLHQTELLLTGEGGWTYRQTK
jgi:ATP-binding cassette subfamily D (ALD) protein 4